MGPSSELKRSISTGTLPKRSSLLFGQLVAAGYLQGDVVTYSGKGVRRAVRLSDLDPDSDGVRLLQTEIKNWIEPRLLQGRSIGPPVLSSEVFPDFDGGECIQFTVLDELLPDFPFALGISIRSNGFLVGFDRSHAMLHFL